MRIESYLHSGGLCFTIVNSTLNLIAYAPNFGKSVTYTGRSTVSNALVTIATGL